MERLNAKFGVPLILTTIGVTIISFGEYKSPLHQEVERLADLNGPVPELRGNSLTNHEEWKEVYKKFGLKYNVNSSDPLHDLSIEQMREYMERHQ